MYFSVTSLTFEVLFAYIYITFIFDSLKWASFLLYQYSSKYVIKVIIKKKEVFIFKDFAKVYFHSNIYYKKKTFLVQTILRIFVIMSRIFQLTEKCRVFLFSILIFSGQLDLLIALHFRLLIIDV